MIIDLWILAVLVELLVLAVGGLVWQARRHPAPALAASAASVPVTAVEAPEETHPPTPVSSDPARRSFWASEAEGSTAVAQPGASAVEAPSPAPPPKSEAPSETPARSEEPKVVLQVLPVYLEHDDLEAAMAAVTRGFGADDLMQLQDVVTSTQSKLQREAKALGAILKRLCAEAEALGAAADTLLPLVQDEAASEELRRVEPSVTSARTALQESTPDLEDLQSTLAAMANGLSSYTAQEWVPRIPTVEGLNERIRNRFEHPLGI